MIRKIFRAQYRDGHEDNLLSLIRGLEPDIRKRVNIGELMALSVFKWMRNLFIYYECVEKEIQPWELLAPLEQILEVWPDENGKKLWLPMMDVFHFNEPQSVEHWRRKQPVEKRDGRVAHLRPDMVASYIYYHYQLQEERAFGGDKYKIIGIDGNLLFMYRELPEVIETPLNKGKLSTTGTPENWENSRMDLHFMPWPDGTQFFIDIDSILSV